MTAPTPPPATGRDTGAYDGHTIDVGYVHTLTDAGDCRDDCPHPDHGVPPAPQAGASVEALAKVARQIAKAQWDGFEADYWDHEVDRRDFDAALNLPPWDEGSAANLVLDVEDTIRRFLASDLLAQRDAAVRAEVGERIASAIEAECAEGHGEEHPEGTCDVCDWTASYADIARTTGGDR